MQTESPAPTTSVAQSPWTTRRALAVSSLTLGFWGSITFWMYPVGLFFSTTGTLLAVISLVMGWKAGREGENLAWLGLFFSVSGLSFAIIAYRFMQFFFEGSLPSLPFLI